MFYMKVIPGVLIAVVIVCVSVSFSGSTQRSSQGKILFLSETDKEIWIMNTDGAEKKILFKGAAVKYPSFSPDGSKVLFSSGTNKNSDIWMVDTGGRKMKRMAKGMHPSFSPDGEKILFTSSMDKDSEVWIMNTDGSKKRRLTEGKWPKFSPDGSKILFLRRSEDKRPLSFSLYIMNQDGTEIKRLTEKGEYPKPPDWDYDGPFFSLDGKRVAFDLNEVFVNFGEGFMTMGEVPKIKIMEIDSGISWEKKIGWLDSGFSPDSYGFSPDGSKVLFELWIPNKDVWGGIVHWMGIMNADGTSQKILAKDGFVIHPKPLFTPDGKKIVFCEYGEFKGERSISIYIMNIDGTGKRRLAGEDAEYLTSSPFLPDGKRIVYAAKHRGKKRIYIMNLDGSDKRMLCDHPDGRIVAFFWEKEEGEKKK
jgi:Tol biopolymer transport system component